MMLYIIPSYILTCAPTLLTGSIEHSLESDFLTCVIPELPSSACILSIIYTYTHWLHMQKINAYNQNEKIIQWLNQDYILSHHIIGIQVSPCALINSFHGKSKLDFIVINLHMERKLLCLTCFHYFIGIYWKLIHALKFLHSLYIKDCWEAGANPSWH